MRRVLWCNCKSVFIVVVCIYSASPYAAVLSPAQSIPASSARSGVLTCDGKTRNPDIFVHYAGTVGLVSRFGNFYKGW